MQTPHFHLKEFFRKLHQKKWLRFIVYSFIVVGFPFFGFYAHFIEPRRIKISHLNIPLKKLSQTAGSLRIVQISDLHFGPTNPSLSFLQKCIEKINALKPDVIALTGDFMQWDHSYAKPLARVLSFLKAKMGVFAILGNHDYGVCHHNENPTDPVDHNEVLEQFSSHGIRVLHNEKETVEGDGKKLRVVGLGDYWTPHFKPDIAFGSENGADLKYPTVLLSHNPDTIHQLKKYPFDLMLSGHAHGGQISFPIIGPLSLPMKHRHLRKGLHHIGNKWLYVNGGLGFIFKARFLSRPEISCLDLVPPHSPDPPFVAKNP